MHWIVGEIAAADGVFKNPNSKVSAHFAVGSNGEIHQYLNINLVAYHAGKADFNNDYIGIEHAGGQKLADGTRKKPTMKAHNNSARLIAYLAAAFGIPLVLIPHKNVVSTSCPGTLDIQYILNKAKTIMNCEQELNKVRSELEETKQVAALDRQRKDYYVDLYNKEVIKVTNRNNTIKELQAKIKQLGG